MTPFEGHVALGTGRAGPPHWISLSSCQGDLKIPPSPLVGWISPEGGQSSSPEPMNVTLYGKKRGAGLCRYKSVISMWDLILDCVGDPHVMNRDSIDK